MQRFRPAVAVLFGAVIAAALAVAPASADYVDNGYVSQADADAACAAIAGQQAPDNLQKFRDAYNTVDNTDDGPASEGISAEWQRVVYLQETYKDSLGLPGAPWADAPESAPTFSCDGGAAQWPASEPGPQPGDECTTDDGTTGTVDENGDCQGEQGDDPSTPPADDNGGHDGDHGQGHHGGHKGGHGDDHGNAHLPGDQANGDGSAPVPTPQPGHLDVTG